MDKSGKVSALGAYGLLAHLYDFTVNGYWLEYCFRILQEISQKLVHDKKKQLFFPLTFICSNYMTTK
jgi:hypothetical protein